MSLQKRDLLAVEDRISHQMFIIGAVFPEIHLHSKLKLYSFQSLELFFEFSLNGVVGSIERSLQISSE